MGPEQMAEVIKGTVEQSGYIKTDEGRRVARDIALGLAIESGLTETETTAFLADCGLEG
jgi:hypothetical protein